jgi:hypothetical protein
MGTHPQEVQGKQIKAREHMSRMNITIRTPLIHLINKSLPSHLQMYRNLTEWNLWVSLASWWVRKNLTELNLWVSLASWWWVRKTQV